jgi:uncharacterized repeat protein (TIGR03803 family)
VKSGIAIAALAFASIFCAGSSAQTFKTLHSFDGTDGSSIYGGLLQATDGNLYGLTFQGGLNGWGTIFRITPIGSLKTLYSFSYGATDGYNPNGFLVQSIGGNFYGTTRYGGVNEGGTVFTVSPNGILTTIYSFCSQGGYSCLDGYYPYAGLVQATDGNFYGTTQTGGANGYGTVFKITHSGTLTTLHSFCLLQGCPDGDSPESSLVEASDGNFYGTTYRGGSNDGGTVFKISPSGALKTIYDFCKSIYCKDGSGPSALIQATDGNFYGTTEGFNYGTVFKISPSGFLKTIHSFNYTDGANPSVLAQGTDGDFYGTAAFGGANGYGTIFKVSTAGELTVLHSFCSLTGCPDGSYPYAPLIQDTNGKFYGSTSGGGSGGGGTDFSLSVGLKPFVKTLPSSGRVGSLVKILGTNLKGATSVSFNGVSATFTVLSGSEITTFVPSGSTTGKVDVVTPTGILVSNVKFRVIP